MERCQTQLFIDDDDDNDDGVKTETYSYIYETKICFINK